ncbi:ankyrin [Rhizophagus irregularis]|uniref:Ankyrin n=1 Tax=Rhizophagus irregularis TaxID=588596 RepID=A0A2N1NZ77_9GLOM|nr:ankyrin [Rhizophagus irregularis]
MKKASLRGKRERKITKTESTTNRSIPLVRRGSSSGSVALKFFGIKKGKKRTTSVLLNNLILAIRDHKTSDALAILSQISSTTLKKKKNGENADRGGISGLKFPSYFILAVALGLHDLVKAMIKRANMNQAWFGLTPLIIATAQASRAPAIDRRSTTSNIIIIIKLFLDHGADPSQGLPLEQFNTLRRLKSKKYMRKLEVLNLLDSANVPSKSHKTFSVPHQLGSNDISAKKAKEDMEKFAKGKWVLPIDIAAISGDIELVKILLSKMEGSNIASSSFCLSIQNDDVMLTLELVHAGANVNQKNFRGSTALHRAARSGHIEMVVVLLQLGANVNIKDDNDWYIIFAL